MILYCQKALHIIKRESTMPQTYHDWQNIAEWISEIYGTEPPSVIDRHSKRSAESFVINEIFAIIFINTISIAIGNEDW